MHKSILLFFISLLFNANLFAVADSNVAINKMLEFKENPNAYIFNYTDKPKEININDKNIQHEAIKLGYKDDNANLIRNNFDKRPDYKFNDGLLKESKIMINNSDSIVEGISNEYIDCQKEQDCKVVFDDIKYCTSGKNKQSYKCSNDLLVDVGIPEKINKRIRFELKVSSKYGGDFYYDLRSQKLTYNSGGEVEAKQDQSFSDITCDKYNSTLLEYGALPGTYEHRVYRTVTLEQNCNNPTIKVSITQGHPDTNKWKTRGAYAIIEVSSQGAHIITDTLVSNCPEIDRRIKAGICVVSNQVCVAPKETKIINGIEVTRDCWRMETKYSCGAKDNDINECQTYEAKNCLQVSAQCMESIDGICSKYNKGYQCPLNKCSGKIAVSCGDGIKLSETIDAYTKPANKEDSNFADSATKLSVIAEAAKDAQNNPGTFNEATAFIFKGRMLECRKTILNFKNCCKDSGWGVDLNLAECSEGEKDLGLKKENQQAIFVSERTDKKYGTEYKQYCVFDSKLARLVQEFGRQAQLGIGFGAKKHIDCRGISANELARINLDIIDLSAAFPDAISKHKEMEFANIEGNVTNRVKKYYSDEVGNG